MEYIRQKNISMPVGKSQELESKKETLPAIEVANHVAWINPAFTEAPISLEIGKKAKLGLFLTPAKETPDIKKIVKAAQSGENPDWDNANIKLDTNELEVARGHGRSGMIGRVVFKDNDGHLYRDLDLKGVGNMYPGAERMQYGRINYELKVYNPYPKPKEGRPEWDIANEAYGIQNLKSSECDRDMIERFQKAGIRTNRIISIIALDEIVVDSTKRFMLEKKVKRTTPTKITISEAKRRGYIPKSAEPVVEVRAFGTKSRLGDRKNIILNMEDAKSLVAQEFEIDPKEFETCDYLQWLAEAVGANLGLMHRNGWHHSYMRQGHNITLDARIVDLDSVSTPQDKSEEIFNYELYETKRALNDFIAALINQERANEQNGAPSYFSGHVSDRKWDRDYRDEYYDFTLYSQDGKKHFYRKDFEAILEDAYRKKLTS